MGLDKMQREAGSGHLAFSNNKILLANQHQCFHHRLTSDTKSKLADLPGCSHANYPIIICYHCKTWWASYCLHVGSTGVILQQVVGVAEGMWER